MANVQWKSRTFAPAFEHWKDGRVVDYTGLENRRTETCRGFESLSFRQEKTPVHLRWQGFFFNWNNVIRIQIPQAVKDVFQIGAYSKLDRDPSGRTITVAYLAVIDIPVKVSGRDDAAKAQWFPLSDLPHLAFDHYDIIQVSHSLRSALPLRSAKNFCS